MPQWWPSRGLGKIHRCTLRDSPQKLKGHQDTKMTLRDVEASSEQHHDLT